MRTIAERVWLEPAVAIGFLTTVAVGIVNLVAGSFDVQNIVGTLAPLVSSLGIRQTVTPVRKKPE